MAAYPTVIIGVGTSGLRIIEQMQRFQYFSGNQDQQISEVRYVYIETDPGTKMESLPEQQYTRRVMINSDFPVADYETLKQVGDKFDWVPTVIKTGQRSEPIRAASGWPGFGRFVLRANFNAALTALGDAIGEAIAGATELNRLEGDRRGELIDTPDPVVFITGTLMGGTGTGVFIDVAYMVRHLNNTVDPIGLFLLPANAQAQAGGPDPIGYGNAYGALKALSLFDVVLPVSNGVQEQNETVQADYEQRLQAIKYKELFPGIGWQERVNSPFRLVQLLSATDRQGRQLSEVSLKKLAGLYLHLNRKGYIAKWLERFVDAEANGQVNQYGTFGLAGVQFPKDDITTDAALELTQALMGRWLHPLNYYEPRDGKYVPIKAVEAELNKKFVEELFVDSPERQATVLSTIRQGFEEQRKTVFTIVQDRHTNVRKYLLTQFGRDVPDGLYGAVGGMVKEMEKELVRRVAERNRVFCGQCESVTMAEQALIKLGERLKDVAAFWRSQGADDWSKTLEALVKDFPGYPQLGVDPDKRKAIQQERLEGLFTLLMKHHLVGTLDRIGDYVQAETVQVVLKADNDTPLPYKGLYTQFRTKFTPIITLVPAERERDFNLAYNRKKIRDEVYDQTVPFERVYPPAALGEAGKDPFEREVARAVAVFGQEVLRTPTGRLPCYSYTTVRERLLGPPTTFWDLLNNWSGQDAYEQLSDGYRKLLRGENCVSNYDVAGHLLANVGTLTNIAKRATVPQLHLRPDLRLNQMLRGGDQAARVERIKVIMGSEERKLTQLLDLLRANGVTEFPNQPDNKAVMTDMENYAFFFKQFVNFKPIIDLADESALERMYKNGTMIGTAADPVFERERTAYFPVLTPLALPPGR